MRNGNLICLINSKNDGNAKKMREENFRGLVKSLHLCVGASIVLIINLLNIGLSNGSTGIVKDIVHEDGTTAPNLPKHAWVDFGEQCTGETFFPDNDERRGWFPVCPVETKYWTKNIRRDGGCEEHVRTILPIKLCWAWTIWKAQGMAIKGKIVVTLTKSEKEHGLTHVTLTLA